MKEGRERSLRRVPRNVTPYRRATIGLLGQRAERVACLKREILLNRMHGGKVVVLRFAQLEKANL